MICRIVGVETEIVKSSEKYFGTSSHSINQGIKIYLKVYQKFTIITQASAFLTIHIVCPSWFWCTKRTKPGAPKGLDHDLTWTVILK